MAFWTRCRVGVSWASPGAAALLLMMTGAARAQGGPPVITDDPFTPRAWHWEINTAVSAEHGPDGTATEVPALDLNYGWGPKLQLKIESPYRWVSGPDAAHNGWGNVLAGVKYRFADRFRGWAISTYPQVEFPVSSKHAGRIDGDSAWAFFLPLEAAHSRGRVEFDAEAGWWFGPPELRSASYGVVVGWIATDALELLSECHAQGSRPFHPGEVVCGLGARQDVTEHVGLMGAFEPVLAGTDEGRPRYHLYLGVQTHIRGGGFWKGARRALIGK